MIDLYEEQNRLQALTDGETTLGLLLRLTARFKMTSRRYADERIARGLCPHDLSTVRAMDGDVRVLVQCDRCGERDVWDYTDPSSDARIFGTDRPASFATGGVIPSGPVYRVGERECHVLPDHRS